MLSNTSPGIWINKDDINGCHIVMEQRVHDPMSEIEAFRQQLIEANPRFASGGNDPVPSSDRKDLIHVDLVVARQALNRLTDNLLKEMGKAKSNEDLVYYAQLRGELCSYFDGLSLLLDDYCDRNELTK